MTINFGKGWTAPRSELDQPSRLMAQKRAEYEAKASQNPCSELPLEEYGLLIVIGDDNED